MAPPPAAAPPITAADVAGAPRPNAAQSVLIPERQPSGAFLWFPRAILLVPRELAKVVFAPLRGLFWAYDKFQIKQRFFAIFFNRKLTFGLFPTAFFETGLGWNVGARLFDTNLFGKGERLRMRAGYGGSNRQIYDFLLDSGDRFGPFQLGLKASYQILPREFFFGVGNQNEVSLNTVPSPTNPYYTAALPTRYKQKTGYLFLSGKLQFTHAFQARLSGATIFQTFADSPSPGSEGQISQFYNTSELAGFDPGVSSLYGEFDLEYNTRRAPSIFNSDALPSEGWYLLGFVGYTDGFSDDPSHFWRWGADIQRYIDLYHGNRILALRLLNIGVTGNLSEIPFTQLPTLGGNRLLRGYDKGRFRDRNASLLQVEYQWGLGKHLDAILFADTGRVWHSIGDLSDGKALRFGYGVALQVSTLKAFILRAQLASSIDGGLFAVVELNPPFNYQERVQQNIGTPP